MRLVYRFKGGIEHVVGSIECRKARNWKMRMKMKTMNWRQRAGYLRQENGCLVLPYQGHVKREGGQKWPYSILFPFLFFCLFFSLHSIIYTICSKFYWILTHIALYYTECRSNGFYRSMKSSSVALSPSILLSAPLSPQHCPLPWHRGRLILQSADNMCDPDLLNTFEDSVEKMASGNQTGTGRIVRTDHVILARISIST